MPYGGPRPTNVPGRPRTALGGVPAPERVKLGHEVVEAAIGDRVAKPGHQFLVVVEIMDRRELRPQHLAAAIEMAKVRAAEPGAARVAGAGLVERTRVALVFR